MMTQWQFLAQVGQTVRLLYCAYNGLFYYRAIGQPVAIPATDTLALELTKRKVSLLVDSDYLTCYRNG